MKNVLVTGGNGFIGRYVCNNLLGKGITPLVLDRFTGKENLDSSFRYFFADVRDETSVDNAVSISDGVIHLAGILGTSETIDNPRVALDTNIYGTLNVLNACRLHKKRGVYISVGNYWMNNPYSLSKHTAERLVWMYNKEHGTEVAVVRALNAYGPKQSIAPVRKIIPNFIVPALKDEELIVYGGGSQIMDMIYVEDVADILVRALLIEHGCYDSELKFDAGTGVHTSVLEIAELVTKMVGKGKIKKVAMRPGEELHSTVLGNPETLRPLFNGKLPALRTLEAGLKPTISYYEQFLKQT